MRNAEDSLSAVLIRMELLKGREETVGTGFDCNYYHTIHNGIYHDGLSTRQGLAAQTLSNRIKNSEETIRELNVTSREILANYDG